MATKILKKLDMVMFEVKYLERWTSVFYEIGVVFFLISCRLTSSSVLVWCFYIESKLHFNNSEKLKNRIFSDFSNFESLYLGGWESKSYEILLVCKKVSLKSDKKWLSRITQKLQHSKIFRFSTIKVLSFHVFGEKKN